MTAFTWTLPAEVLALHDGDTFTMRCDLGWDISLKTQVRLDGVDTPELDTDAGKAALAWVVGVMPVGTVVVLESRKREKYGRILATVQLPDGRDLAKAIIDAGHGVEYHGGRKVGSGDGDFPALQQSAQPGKAGLVP